MSGGERDRPWYRAGRQTLTDTILERAGQEAALSAETATNYAQRATMGAAQDRSLDIMRKARGFNAQWYEPLPWRKAPLVPGPVPSAPGGRLVTGPPSPTSGFARAARGLRAAAPALRAGAAVARGISGALNFSVRGVPVVGIAVEMLHSSPLADGTRRAAGREMLNRYRARQDPYRGYDRLSRLDRRRFGTFMQLGMNPLWPGTSPEGKPYVYYEDLGLHEPIGNRHVVFAPEYVHLSPQILPAGRARPWTAVGGPPSFGH